MKLFFMNNTDTILYLKRTEDMRTGKGKSWLAVKKEAGIDLILVTKKKFISLAKKMFHYEHIKEIEGNSITSIYTVSAE